jgi:MFS family permease
MVYLLSNTLLWGVLMHMGMESRLRMWFGSRWGFYFGLLGAIGADIAAVTEVVAGALSDRSLNRWGRRRPYVAIGSILALGPLILLGAAKSFWPFAVGLLLIQLFTNLALGPFTALMPDTVHPREHGKASGFMGAARLIGDIGGMVLAGIMLSSEALKDASPGQIAAYKDHQFFLLCLGMAVFIALTTAYTCWMVPERPLTRRPEAGIAQIIRQSYEFDRHAHPDFLWLCISRAVTNIGFYMFIPATFGFVAHTLEYEDRAEGMTMKLLLPAVGAAILSTIPSGWISDRVGRRGLVFVAQFLMAAGAVGFAVAPTFGLALLAGIPAGLAYGVFTAVEWALACNLLPKNDVARYLGFWNATAVVPQVFALALAGVIGSGLSSATPGLGWRIDFALAAALCLVGAYFLKHVRERRS